MLLHRTELSIEVFDFLPQWNHTSDADGLALGVNVGTFTLVELDVAALVTGDETKRLHDRAELDGSDRTTGQQRSEQEVVARRDNHLQNKRKKSTIKVSQRSNFAEKKERKICFVNPPRKTRKKKNLQHCSHRC